MTTWWWKVEEAREAKVTSPKSSRTVYRSQLGRAEPVWIGGDGKHVVDVASVQPRVILGACRKAMSSPQRSNKRRRAGLEKGIEQEPG